MRVTHQNGAIHGLTRKEVETIVQCLPPLLGRGVSQLVLYQGTGAAVEFSYYARERVLGFFWPAPDRPGPEKYAAIEALLVALSIIAERGDLPQPIARALRVRHQQEIAALAAQCESAIAAIRGEAG